MPESISSGALSGSDDRDRDFFDTSKDGSEASQQHQGVSWAPVDISALHCQPPLQVNHCIVQFSGSTGRDAAGSVNTNVGVNRFIVLGGDSEPKHNAHQMFEIAYHAPKMCNPLSAGQSLSSNKYAPSSIIVSDAGDICEPASDTNAPPAPAAATSFDSVQSPQCARDGVSHDEEAGGSSIGSAQNTSQNRSQSIHDNMESLDLDTPLKSLGFDYSVADTDAGLARERLEWHLAKSELPRRLRSCSVATLGGGLVAVFGGLRIPDGEGWTDPMQGETLCSTLPKRAEASGELLMLDALKGQWMTISTASRHAHSSRKNDRDPHGKERGGRLLEARTPKRAAVALAVDDDDTPFTLSTPSSKRDTATPKRAQQVEVDPKSAMFFQEGEAPRPRFEHGATPFMCSGRAMVVHGGRGTKRAKPMDSMCCLELIGKTLRWKQLMPARIVLAAGESARDHGQVLQAQSRRRAFVRRAHTITAAPGVNNRVFLFGGIVDHGEDGRICNDLMICDLDMQESQYKINNTLVYGKPPEPRAYHTAVVLGHFFAVFGGLSRKGAPLCDLYLFHIISCVWCKVTSPLPDQESPVPWPCARWGHAAVYLERPAAHGGIAMLIFGGIGADKQILGDTHLMSFKQPVSAAGSGSGPAPEALSTYPPGVVLSLWERLFANLQHLQSDQLKIVQKVQSETEELFEKLCEKEQQLAKDEGMAARVVNEFQKASQREKEARKKLAEIKEQRAKEANEVRVATEAAETKVEILRRRLQRLQVTSEVLELGRLIPPEDVTAHPDDVGATVPYVRPYVPSAHDGPGFRDTSDIPKDSTFRRVGAWRGSPVSVEDICHTRVITTESRPEGNTLRPVRVSSTLGNVSGAVGGLHLGLVADEPHRRQSGNRQLSSGLQHSSGTINVRQVWEEAVRKELRLTGRLRHPNLVEYYGAAVDNAEVHIISEPPLLPLQVELNARESSWLQKPKARRGLVYDVALALDYLHSHGIAHHCVTIEHIFLRDGMAQPTAKLGGLLPMRIFHRVRCEMPHIHTIVDDKVKSRGGRVEVPRAKENEKPHTHVDPRSLDVYALGCLAVQLLTIEGGLLDGPAVNNSRDGISTGAVRSSAVNRIHDRSLRLIVLRCMEKDPQYRMSARMVVRAMSKIAQGSGVVCLEDIPDDPTIKTPLCDPELLEFAESKHSSIK